MLALTKSFVELATPGFQRGLDGSVWIQVVLRKEVTAYWTRAVKISDKLITRLARWKKARAKAAIYIGSLDRRQQWPKTRPQDDLHLH
jgi:hypothetical protein